MEGLEGIVVVFVLDVLSEATTSQHCQTVGRKTLHCTAELNCADINWSWERDFSASQAAAQSSKTAAADGVSSPLPFGLGR
jgi:hypothetical protein